MSPARTARILELYRQGASPRQIAVELRCSTPDVEQVLVDLNVSIPADEWEHSA